MPKILHVDGDGFFAACEISRRPDLKGKPVVVGEERGIATAMSYEAKKLGITRSTPIFQVKRDFPQVTVLSSHFELYEHFSKNLYTILSKHFDHVEVYSIDECFALVPDSYKKPDETWEHTIMKLKQEVQTCLGITYSFGLADTKVLSKVASKLNKPDGCTIIDASNRESALAKTAIGDVWGIGWQTSSALTKIGLVTALDFIHYPESSVARHFSEPILALWHELSGTPLHSVHSNHDQRKSMQATRSFSPTSNDRSFVYSELSRNIEVVCRRLRDSGLATKTFSVYLKPKALWQARHTASFELPLFTQNPADLLRAITRIFDTKIFKKGTMYRSTGVSVYGLVAEDEIPMDLFETEHQALDSIWNMPGLESVQLASSLLSTNTREATAQERARKDTYVEHLPLPYMGEVW